MREYLISVMAIFAVSALVSLLVPEGARSKRYMRLAVGAVALITVAEPLMSDMSVSGNLSLPRLETETADADAYLSAVIENTERTLEAELQDELFSVWRLSEEYADADVRLDVTDPADVKFKSVTVTLKSYGAWADADGIRLYFEEKLGTEVNVVYE